MLDIYVDCLFDTAYMQKVVQKINNVFREVP